MKKRFSDEQIINIFREAEAGVSARELCRKYATSDATLYTWRRRWQNYNEYRPHSSFNYQPPSEFAAGWGNGEYGSKLTDIIN